MHPAVRERYHPLRLSFTPGSICDFFFSSFFGFIAIRNTPTKKSDFLARDVSLTCNLEHRLPANNPQFRSVIGRVLPHPHPLTHTAALLLWPPCVSLLSFSPLDGAVHQHLTDFTHLETMVTFWQRSYQSFPRQPSIQCGISCKDCAAIHAPLQYI